MTHSTETERVELIAERAELVAKNEAATSWGAAVGARHERIVEIDRRLAALCSFAQDQKPVAWICFDKIEQRQYIITNAEDAADRQTRPEVSTVTPLYLYPPPAAGWDEEYPYDDERFNKGVLHVVDLIARNLGVDQYVAGDGSEDYDCDLWQTVLNILAAKGLYDKDECEFASIRTTPAATKSADAGGGVRETLLSDEWSRLVEKDDRTSPEEYPDMCLITRDEVGEIIDAALSHQPAPVAADLAIADFNEPPSAPWPDPTPDMLNGDALFDAIWETIKSWDVNVPAVYSGYCGACGNHVRAIYDAVKSAPVAANASAEARLREAHIRVLDGLGDATTKYPLNFGPNKTTGDHLRFMIKTIKSTPLMPIDKIARWTGFIQGVLCARGVIDVDAERDRTRPIFSAHPHASDCDKQWETTKSEGGVQEPPASNPDYNGVKSPALVTAHGLSGQSCPLNQVMPDPSDRTADVTVDEVAECLYDAIPTTTASSGREVSWQELTRLTGFPYPTIVDAHRKEARALLDAYGMWRR